MAIFKASARDGSVSLVIRARCISCARQIAAERSPADEFALWSSPVMSGVEWVHDPEAQGYLADGKTGIIKRIQA
jgi:hypothetical protein